MTLNELLTEISKAADHYLEPIVRDVFRGFFFQHSLMDLQILSIIIIFSMWVSGLVWLIGDVATTAEIVNKKEEDQALTSKVCKKLNYGLLLVGWLLLYYLGYELTADPLYFLAFTVLGVWLPRLLVLRLYDPETKRAVEKAKNVEH
mgnify:CR=1 FL=1|jgi:hypothetical protein